MDLADLGTEIDPVGLVPGTLPLSRAESDGLHAEALWVDRFGNVQLNVDPEELREMSGEVGGTVSLTFHGTTMVARRIETFGSLPIGGLGLVIDSHGLIAVVANQASAAEETGLAAGDEVVLVATGSDTPDRVGGAGAAIPVELGRTSKSRPNGGERQATSGGADRRDSQ